jgi:hypothetical protein
MMVAKATFEALALPHFDRNYFLRPDRLLAAFLLDPSRPPLADAESRLALSAEAAADRAGRAALQAISAAAEEEEEEEALPRGSVGEVGRDLPEVSSPAPPHAPARWLRELAGGRGKKTGKGDGDVELGASELTTQGASPTYRGGQPIAGFGSGSAKRGEIRGPHICVAN